MPPTLGSATPRVAVEAAVVVGPTATVAWTAHCCSAWIASVTFVLLYWSFPPRCMEVGPSRRSLEGEHESLEWLQGGDASGFCGTARG